jgi:hypothetical protein
MTPEIIKTLAAFYDMPADMLEREMAGVPMTEEELAVVGEGNWTDLKRFPDGRVACVARFIYTSAILDSVSRMGHENRWCYHTRADAQRALAQWDGTGEPQGWFRHPDSGRRVNEQGDIYVQP